MVRERIPESIETKNGAGLMKAKEFWHESLTQASWEKLAELSKEYDFTVIGGWAAWLWTKQHKSRDIDIVADYGTLEGLRQKYGVRKNDRLKKYEIKMQDFDVDIYVPYYSKLEIPAEELSRETAKIEGIKTVSPESLLILKQGAEIARRNTVKGVKDRIDILTILVHSPVSLEKYGKKLSQYKKQSLKKELIHAITSFNPKDSEQYLGLKMNEFAKRKKELMRKIKNLAD